MTHGPTHTADLYPGVFDGSKLEIAPSEQLYDVSNGIMVSEGRTIHCPPGLLTDACSFSRADYPTLQGDIDAHAINRMFFAHQDTGDAATVVRAINGLESIDGLLSDFRNIHYYPNLPPQIDTFNETLRRLGISAHIPVLPHRKREPTEFYPYITDAAHALGEKLGRLRLREIQRLGSVILRGSNPTIEGMDTEDARFWVSIDAPDTARRRGEPVLLAPLGGVALPGTDIGPSIEFIYDDEPNDNILNFVYVRKPHIKPVVSAADGESYLMPETWGFQQPLLYRRLEYGKEAAWLGRGFLSEEA